MKVGITGQSGFIGAHLFNFLSLDKDIFQLIPFKKHFFQDDKQLDEFVRSCDVIVHLAAMNRHNDPATIYETNKLLVSQLVKACERTGATPHIIFSSSTQEEKENPYGLSKKEGRALLIEWAAKTKAMLTGLIIPNVFGPFGNPYYNSVIATFAHQLTHEEEPKIDIDGYLKLIYVGELVQIIKDCIINGNNNPEYYVAATYEAKVSEILIKLQKYKAQYFEKGNIPSLETNFDTQLFNTFRSYINHEQFFPFILKKNEDTRGIFVETIKTEIGGQFSFSTTKSEITRGNHFHTRKIERFAVIKGHALIQFRKVNSEKIYEFKLDGENPAFVDMPIWFTHNIKNIGNEELLTLFWINESYDPNDPDTFFVQV